MDADNPRGRGLELDPLVRALTPGPGKPPRRTSRFFGLVGESPGDGHTRLWLDADLTSYVDIPDEAILYSKRLDDDAGSVLWVAAEADLSYGSATSYQVQARFLAGAITAAHLATTMGALPGTMAARALIQQIPSMNAGSCPTQGLGWVPGCPGEQQQLGPSLLVFCPVPVISGSPACQPFH